MKLSEATILVVDDEPELLEIFSIWIGRSCGRVLKAQNGAEAMKILTAQKIDALISDIRMPVMDGITLVRKLHESNIFIPSIIFVSGFGDIDPREAHALGVEAMLPKPLSRKVLLQALEDSLKAREELWLTPPESTPQADVRLRLESFQHAVNHCMFHIGRGGCCFLAQEPLAEETDIALSVEFIKDEVKVSGRARVRWCDGKDARMGVEFLFLAPEGRDWVIAKMQGDAIHAYIPRC